MLALAGIFTWHQVTVVSVLPYLYFQGFSILIRKMHSFVERLQKSTRLPSVDDKMKSQQSKSIMKHLEMRYSCLNRSANCAFDIVLVNSLWSCKICQCYSCDLECLKLNLFCTKYKRTRSDILFLGFEVLTGLILRLESSGK